MTPRECCGDLSPSMPGGASTECVLHPGHTGSHADRTEKRWRTDADGPEPADGPLVVQLAEARAALTMIGLLLDRAERNGRPPEPAMLRLALKLAPTQESTP